MKKKIIVKFIISIFFITTTFSMAVSAKELKNTQSNNLVHNCANKYDPHPIDVDLPE